METKIEIKKEALLKTYQDGSDAEKKLLESLGKEQFKPNITGRVKTFEDAVRELGEGHPMVLQYRRVNNEIILSDTPILDESTDIVAYLKLRIITAALNEGWKPQFTKDEWRYYPWFYFYTQEEFDRLSEQDKKNCVLFGGRAAGGADAGFVYANSVCAPSAASAGIGSRLCFKTSELAKYAGKQFIDIYADYLL